MIYKFSNNEANQLESKIRSDYPKLLKYDFGYQETEDVNNTFIDSSILELLPKFDCDLEAVFQFVFTLTMAEVLESRVLPEYELLNYVDESMLNHPINSFDFKKLNISLYEHVIEEFGDFVEIIYYTDNTLLKPVVRELFTYNHDLIGPISRTQKIQYYYSDGTIDEHIYDRGEKFYNGKYKKTAGIRKRKNIVESMEKTIVETIVGYKIQYDGRDPNDMQILIDEAGALAIGFVIKYKTETEMFETYNNKAIKDALLLDDVNFPWLGYLETNVQKALRTHLVDLVYQGLAWNP